MSLFSFIVFFYVLQTSFAGKNTIPVFMLDHDQVMSHVQVEPNPFAKLTTAGFADIIHDSIKRSEGVIIFMEDSFSVEDISTKDKYGTPYTHLRSGLIENKVKYFPSVIDPYRLLNQIFHPQQSNVFYLSSRTKLQLKDNFKFIYIFFQDGVNETRSQVLRRHDAIIKEVVFVVRQLKPGPVVAFYTGKLNPVVVQKVEFLSNKPDPVQNKKGVTIASPGGLFQLYGVYTTTTTRRSVIDQIPVVAEETITRRTMSTKIQFPVFDLEFAFNFNDDGWILDHVGIYELGEDVGRTDMGVGAPWNYSLWCSEPIVVINNRDLSLVTITQYQIEPFITTPLYKTASLSQRDNVNQALDDNASQKEGSEVDRGDHKASNSQNKQFSPSIHCGPYFSSPVISALLVTGICLSIALYGIMSLFDCVSGDRYEDPNSKPLVHEVMH